MRDEERSDGGETEEPTEPNFAKSWVNTDEAADDVPIDVTNVKEEWENLTIYLPEQLRDEIELSFSEASYECLNADGYDLQKLRDFYPLLIVLGLESLEGIEGEEIPDILRYSATEYGLD
jgi:hypothetical protein